MKGAFEATKAELLAAFGEGFDLKNPIEISLGKEVFTCYVSQYSTRNAAWTDEMLIQMSVEGSSKRLQDIANAKALVNKTKEAHKEAQRKLAALQDEK